MISLTKNVTIIAALTFIIVASTAGTLTEKEKKQLKRVFDKYDTDGNGTLNIEEFKKLMKSIHKNMPEEEVIKNFEEADKNNNGTIDFDEFLTVNDNDDDDVEQKEKDLKEAFLMYDEDKNGFISVDELQKTLKKLGEVRPKHEVIQMINEVDTDGDGQVNYEEFKKMLNNMND